MRMSPLSAGTVTISPWTSSTARWPVGEMFALRILAAVGKKINLVPHPQGVEVVGVIFLRDFLFEARIGKAHNPDALGLPPAIAFPRRLPLEVRDIGELRAVGREDALFSHGQRDLAWEAAFSGHRKELARVGGARAIGSEKNILPVRRPRHGHVRRAVIRQPARDPARRGNDKYVHIAVVLAREGDLGAVG